MNKTFFRIYGVKSQSSLSHHIFVTLKSFTQGEIVRVVIHVIVFSHHRYEMNSFICKKQNKQKTVDFSRFLIIQNQYGLRYFQITLYLYIVQYIKWVELCKPSINNLAIFDTIQILTSFNFFKL